MTILHQNKKIDIIAHALVHKGVCVWSGIPEHIIEELKINGYKIKRSKKFKR
jgi:adenylate kinase